MHPWVDLWTLEEQQHLLVELIFMTTAVVLLKYYVVIQKILRLRLKTDTKGGILAASFLVSIVSTVLVLLLPHVAIIWDCYIHHYSLLSLFVQHYYVCLVGRYRFVCILKSHRTEPHLEVCPI